MKNLGCRLESNPGPLSSATSALATTTLVFQDLNIFSFILLSSIACCSLILNIPPIMYRQNTFRCRPVSFFFFPDPFRWESFYLVCMKGHLIIVMLKPFQSTNYGSFSRGRGVSRRHQKGIFIDVFIDGGLLSMRLQQAVQLNSIREKCQGLGSQGCCNSVVRALVAEASGPGFDSQPLPRYFIFSFAIFPDPFR